MQAALASRLRAQSGGYLIRAAASSGRQAAQDPDRVGKASPGSVKPVHSNTWKAQAFRSSEMSDGVTTSGVDGLSGSKPSLIVGNGVNGNGNGEGKSTVSSVIDFMMMVHSLKTQKRTGWIKRGVQDPESISDHMHRMSLLALAVPATPGIDRDRCIKMALVHDVAEAIVGDITPTCGVSKEDKRKMESDAMDELCATLGEGAAADELRALWMEYEGNSTAEAKLVKDFDKLEMIVQAMEYEEAQGHDLQEFFDSTRGKFQTPVGQQLAAEVVARRLRMLSSKSADAAQDTN